jgi:PAS domain S-box-containing protein
MQLDADRQSLSSSGEEVGHSPAPEERKADDEVAPPPAKRLRGANTGFTDNESDSFSPYPRPDSRLGLLDQEDSSLPVGRFDVDYTTRRRLSPLPPSVQSRSFRKKSSQRLRKSKAPNEDPSPSPGESPSALQESFAGKISEFMHRLGNHSKSVFRNDLEQVSASESGSESTEVLLEDDSDDEPGLTEEQKEQRDMVTIFGKLTSQEEKNAMIKKMQDDQEKVEDELYNAHQHFLGQADKISLMESHLKESRFLDEIQELQRVKQKELFAQRLEMRQEVRSEELLHWQQRRQKIRRREQLDLMKRKNFGMMQMRKIIEHKRYMFNLWTKSLENRQKMEREHLANMQKRKKNSRAALFTVRMKNLKPAERKHLQKEFKIAEQHHKMVDFKQLQYLEEYHKIHRTFAVRKFEQEIHVLEGEQLMYLEHEEKVGELLISHADAVLEALTDIEAIKCDIEDAHLRISHHQMFRSLRLQQRKAHRMIEDFHEQQLRNPGVFEVDHDTVVSIAPALETSGRIRDSMARGESIARSLWSWSLSPCDNGSFILVDSLFRMVSYNDSNSQPLNSAAQQRTVISDTGSESSSMEGNAYNYDEHSFDRQLSRERKRLAQLQSEYQNSILALESLKTRHLAELRELRSEQQKELHKYFAEKMEMTVQLLGEKEAELKNLSHAHNRERSSLVSLQAKELENFRALLKKEVDLQRTAQQMKAVMEAMLDPMIVSDEYGRMIVVNEAASKMFEYEISELLGQNVSILVDPKISRHHDAYLKRYRETNEPHIIGTAGREVYGRKKCGELVPMHLSVSENVVEDRRIFIGCLHDLSENKKRELMLQKAKDEATTASQAKSYFLAQMSHEIRTPLHAMLGFSELLENASSLTTEQSDMVTSIRQCGTVLLSILSDVRFSCILS